MIYQKKNTLKNIIMSCVITAVIIISAVYLVNIISQNNNSPANAPAELPAEGVTLTVEGEFTAHTTPVIEGSVTGDIPVYK